MKTAITFGHGLSPSEIVLGAKRSEEYGFDFVWISESTGIDALSVLGSIATGTKKIELGSGIVNVYSRTPAQIAMSAATIDELSGGRFTLGVGASSKNVVANWHGLKYVNQIEKVRKSISEIREKLDELSLPSFSKEKRTREKKIPIVLACVQPRMVSLSKEVADGALFFMRPLSTLKKEVPALSKESFKIFATSICCVSRDAKLARKRVQNTVAFYLTFGEAYRNLIVKEIPSVAEKAQEIKSSWLKGKRDDSASLVSEELLNEVAIYGTPQDVRRKIESDYANIKGLSMLGLRFEPGEKTLEDSFVNLSHII